MSYSCLFFLFFILVIVCVFRDLAYLANVSRLFSERFLVLLVGDFEVSIVDLDGIVVVLVFRCVVFTVSHGCVFYFSVYKIKRLGRQCQKGEKTIHNKACRPS